jgi:hypothetical protein
MKTASLNYNAILKKYIFRLVAAWKIYTAAQTNKVVHAHVQNDLI